ncbi:MAG: LrgB family protein [Pseudomonadota bacterium]
MEFIFAHPLTSLLVTLGSFAGFGWLQKKAGGHAALNPVVWAIIICVAFIHFSGIDYQTYMQGAQPVHFLLGPVTVALAVPLYRLLDVIRKDAPAILLAIGLGCLFSAGSAMGIAGMMMASEEMQLAIASKSVTAPIAIEIANKIGTPSSLAVLFVFMTNIPWLLFTGVLFKTLRVKDERTQGIALGTVCHGLGAARAFQISETAGTYAVIGMSLMGIFSGLLLPVLILKFF